MNAELLNSLIIDKKISKAALAEELGLTRQGLYNKLNGEREFVGSEIKKLSAVLDLSDDERNAIFFSDDVGAVANTPPV